MPTPLMAQDSYVGEFEINASKKILYPYLSTASGLAQWFAEDVNITADRHFDFLWDGEHHLAEITHQKLHSHIRFTFLEDDKEPGEEYVEFRIIISDLTDTLFLQIEDNSAGPGDPELQSLYETNIASLKEIIGG